MTRRAVRILQCMTVKLISGIKVVSPVTRVAIIFYETDLHNTFNF